MTAGRYQVAVPRSRRHLLLGGLCACALGCAGVAGGMALAAGTRVVSLAACGGRPGSGRVELVKAFALGFELLRSAGGGVLEIGPGIYDFGRQVEEASIVLAENLHDVRIHAHGALFMLDTVADVVPCLFYFVNPVNVVLEGASFSDTGYNARVNWRGMVCVRSEATVPVHGFMMQQCAVDGAVALFQCHQHRRYRFLSHGIRVQGSVKNAYYGASFAYVGDDVDLDLGCENVRRGCIAYGLKNATLRLRATHARGIPASNGFIALVCEGASAGDVRNVRVGLEFTGPACHGSLVHFYHQQTERDGAMVDIHAHVSLSGMRQGDAPLRVFLFDHELPDATIARRTARAWDRISLSGETTGKLQGRVVDNPSESTTSMNISLDPVLSAYTDFSRVPPYFHGSARPRVMPAQPAQIHDK